MEIESENPNIFIDFIVQSGSFVDCSREEIERVADIGDWLCHVDMIERVLIKGQHLQNYNWKCKFINRWKSMIMKSRY